MSSSKKINSRRCPSCSKRITWSTNKKGPGKSVQCIDYIRCKWKGPFYDSVPAHQSSPDRESKKAMLALMHRALNMEVSGSRALYEFEEFTLQHPNADPSEKGNKEMERYISNISQLQFLQGILDMSDIRDDDIKSLIMKNEVDRIFPKGSK